MNKNDFTIINGILLEYTGEDTEVTVPDGAAEIGISAFEYSGVKKITLPESVKRIEWDAFSDCSELKTVVLPYGIEEIEERAFEGCDSLEYTEYCGCRYLGSAANPYLALAVCESRDITEINVHKDTKLILARAFEDCEKLTSVAIPEGVRYIGTAAFQSCTALESVTFPESITIFIASQVAECVLECSAVVVRMGIDDHGYSPKSCSP